MTTLATTTVGLCLEPLDVLFFRDGRPFTGSERSVSGQPLPQTLAGAIRTGALLPTARGLQLWQDEGRQDVRRSGRAIACTNSEHHWIRSSSSYAVPGWHEWQMEGDAFEVFVPVSAILQVEKGQKSVGGHSTGSRRC